jgi:hypothetical protein
VSRRHPRRNAPPAIYICHDSGIGQLRSDATAHQRRVGWRHDGPIGTEKSIRGRTQERKSAYGGDLDAVCFFSEMVQ